MLNKQYVTKLINLEGIKVKDIYIEGDEVRILVTKENELEICPKCEMSKTKLVESKPKNYRDLNILDRSCWIEIDQKRLECCYCFHTFMETLPFARSYRHYTNRFENKVYECCQETNASYTGAQFKLSDHTVSDIYEKHAIKKQEELKLENPVKKIGIDEIAMHKGHQDFILIITDLSNNRVLDVLKDRKKETLEAYLDGLSQSFKRGIEVVAIDLWNPFRSAIEKYLPKACIVADRFHVMKNLNNGLDICRKIEKKFCNQAEEWKHSKYALLKNKENLTEEQKVILNKVLNFSPQLKQAYEIKEGFREIFNETKDREEAKLKLHNWLLDIVRKDLTPCYEFVRTFLNWEDNILNYFIDRVTSGFIEGVNNKIKLIKRKAFGFKNFEHFRIKIIDCFS